MSTAQSLEPTRERVTLLGNGDFAVVSEGTDDKGEFTWVAQGCPRSSRKFLKQGAPVPAGSEKATTLGEESETGGENGSAAIPDLSWGGGGGHKPGNGGGPTSRRRP